MSTAGTSFLTQEEIAAMGFESVGREVQISRCARFYGTERIHIGSRVRIDDFCILSGGKGIRIGSCIHIAVYTVIYGGGGVVVRDFANISSRVAIYSESDDYSGRSLTSPLVPLEFKPGLQTAPVTVGRHAILGSGTTLLPGVTLGDGAAVGAHSLVTRDCPPWTIWAGSPARMLKKRSQDLLELERLFIAQLRKTNAGWLADQLETP